MPPTHEQQLRVTLLVAPPDVSRIGSLPDKLQNSGIIELWFAPEQLSPAADWHATLHHVLHESDAVIACLSSSTADTLTTTPFEDIIVQLQQQPHYYGLLLLLDSCTPPPLFQQWQEIHLYSHDGFYRLMRSIRKRANEVMLSGQTIANYFIEEPIGKSSMGKVYRAYHSSDTSRQVALMVLHEAITTAPHFREQFEREAHRATTLTHPHILPITDYGYSDLLNRYYLVMPFSSHGSLYTLLTNHTAHASQQLPLSWGIELIRQAATALAVLHENGNIHGLVHPRNLLLNCSAIETHITATTHCSLQVADVCMASLIDWQEFVASDAAKPLMPYLAPEQRHTTSGMAIDGRCDVYALGVVLYQMATGRLPYDNTTQDSVSAELIPPRVVNPDIPPELEACIVRCLAKDRTHRFATVGELADVLAHIAPHEALQQIRLMARPADAYIAPALAHVVGVSLDTEHITMSPGTTKHLTITLVNRGTLHRTLHINVMGIDDVCTIHMNHHVAVAPLETIAVDCTVQATEQPHHHTHAMTVLVQDSATNEHVATYARLDIHPSPTARITRWAIIVPLLLVLLVGGWALGNTIQSNEANSQQTADVDVVPPTTPSFGVSPTAIPAVMPNTRTTTATAITTATATTATTATAITTITTTTTRVPLPALIATNTSRVTTTGFIAVPDVLFLHKDDAIAILQALNLKTFIHLQEHADVCEAYQVLRIMPDVGSRVEARDTVTLEVCAPPRMPNVVGLPRHEAEAQLRALGISIEIDVVATEESDTKSEEYIVQSTIPAPDAVMEPGSSVMLFVAGE